MTVSSSIQALVLPYANEFEKIISFQNLLSRLDDPILLVRPVTDRLKAAVIRDCIHFEVLANDFRTYFVVVRVIRVVNERRKRLQILLVCITELSNHPERIAPCRVWILWLWIQLDTETPPVRCLQHAGPKLNQNLVHSTHASYIAIEQELEQVVWISQSFVTLGELLENVEWRKCHRRLVRHEALGKLLNLRR